MAGKEIRISIMSALNAAGIEATKEQVARMADSVGKSMGKAAADNRHHWADIKAAWDLGLSAIRTVGGLIRSALKKAFDAEYALTNFRTLLGSLDAAKEHVAELKRFASRTPLTFGDLSQASKTLLAFGADVKDVVPSLKMLGDISLGNAEKFQSLALAFGKVQSAGKLSGIELKQMIIAGFNPLVEISEKTGASMDELKKMMEEGAITYDLVAAAMKSATSEGGRFNNAMEEASKTGTGLVSTLQDNWTAAVTKFGTAFLNASKEGLGAMIQKLQELNNNGTIDVWADKVAAALEKVASWGRVAAEWGGKLKDAWDWSKDQIQSASAFWGTLAGGGSLDDASKNHAKVLRENKKEREDDQKREQMIRAEAIKRRAQEEAAEKGKEAEKSMSLEEIFIEKKRKKQEEADRKAAEKKAEEDRKAAEKKAAADKKAAERAAAERERMEAKEAARRERERQREMRNQIRDQSKVLSDARQAESLAQSRVAAAESKVQQAWGWYRDKRSMAAQLKEERANAKAEAQYEKDFRRLSRRSDWRTATNLSIGDEAVRRVAIAKEEEAAAKKAAIETAENTKKAAEKLQELSENLEKSLEVN